MSLHPKRLIVHLPTYPHASPSVLWYCWLGLLTCKNRLPYNLYCVGKDVKHCTIRSCPIHMPTRSHVPTNFDQSWHLVSAVSTVPLSWLIINFLIQKIALSALYIDMCIWLFATQCCSRECNHLLYVFILLYWLFPFYCLHALSCICFSVSATVMK